MTSSPQETETIEVKMSREERWTAHYVLVREAENTIDSGESLPQWLPDLVETIEAGSTTFSQEQATHLSETVGSYLRNEHVPQRDVVHGTAITERFDAAT